MVPRGRAGGRSVWAPSGDADGRVKSARFSRGPSEAPLEEAACPWPVCH